MNNFTIKNIDEENFTKYKKPSMFISTAHCSIKCGNENCNNCSRGLLSKQPDININIFDIINRYLNNTNTSALVLGGLEPLSHFNSLYDFIFEFRRKCNDDVIIYTGYSEDEIKYFKYNRKSFLNTLIEINKYFSKNVHDSPTLIIVYNCFESSKIKKFDEILGIDLIASKQYAKLYR